MSRAPAAAPAPASIEWLLAVALLVVAPVVLELPTWVSVIYFTSAIWRLAHDRWRWPQPGGVVRGLLAIAAIFLVHRQFGTLLGREPGVALLVLLTGFKLLELRTLRDAVLAALLLLLLVLGGFLFDNSLARGLHALLAVVAVVAVLVRIQHPRLAARPVLRLAGAFVVQALPIMLAAYLLFPRLDALWGSPSAGGAMTTGIPDDMRFGDITALNSSDAIAFRAYFAGEPPPARSLYWRVRIFWDNDGRTWQTGAPLSNSERLLSATDRVEYRLVVEPSDKAWLPVLDVPVSTPPTLRPRAGFIYETARARTERQTFALASATRYRTGPIDLSERTRALALPPAVSGRVRALAQQWRLRARNERDIVRAALGYFRQEAFFYTLIPPPLGPDPVDEFLFETRRGFCEHYAAAFVTLMRLAHVPARVVVGYQGGVFNPAGNYLIVRQADAHAWAEVWMPDAGWVRVDPTAAVAPTRIEYGIDGVRRLQSQGLPLAGIGADVVRRAMQLPWLEHARLRARLAWDYVNLSWYLWVADYNLERQAQLFARFGITNAALVLVGAVALQLMLLYGLFQWRARQRIDAVQRLYNEYCRKLSNIGIARAIAEGPLALAKRARAQRPELAPTIDRITWLYVNLRYGNGRNTPELREFASAVRSFRPSRGDG
ncbi:MAG: DUF3488 and DUF4129 domain-containing transglutaminase family protein [Sulfurifustis sp.]